MFLMNADLVIPWPLLVSRLCNSTYVVCSYRTISRIVGIGGDSKLAKAPVWFGATDALVKVPKFSVTCVTRLVGDHGTDAPSALMAVSGGSVVALRCCKCQALVRRKTAFHFVNREKVECTLLIPKTVCIVDPQHSPYS